MTAPAPLLLLLTLFSTLWVEALGQPDLQLEHGEIRQLLLEIEQEQIAPHTNGEDGIGGTGAPARDSEGGIGGTGIRVSIDEHGIGGTGITPRSEDGGIGGTGIIGEITGFGSIIVNGVHIDYQPEMAVHSSMGTTSAAGLKIGQVVMVEAQQQGNRYRAHSIALSHPIIGPITARASDGSSIQVLGQTVLLDGNHLLQRELQLGETIAVSGFWEGNQLHATQLESAPEGLVALTGTVTVRQMQPYIGEVPLHISDSSTDSPMAGERRTLFGTARADHGLSVSRSIELPAAPFNHRVERLLIEGYVTPHAGRMQIEGVPLTPSAVTLEGRQQMHSDFRSGENMELRPLMPPPDSVSPGMGSRPLHPFTIEKMPLKLDASTTNGRLPLPMMGDLPDAANRFGSALPKPELLPQMEINPLLSNHPPPLHHKYQGGAGVPSTPPPHRPR